MKEYNSYVFTLETSHDRMITRETITKDVNQLMRKVSKELSGQPSIRS
jgi:hypothetical protein